MNTAQRCLNAASMSSLHHCELAVEHVNWLDATQRQLPNDYEETKQHQQPQLGFEAQVWKCSPELDRAIRRMLQGLTCRQVQLLWTGLSPSQVNDVLIGWEVHKDDPARLHQLVSLRLEKAFQHELVLRAERHILHEQRRKALAEQSRHELELQLKMEAQAWRADLPMRPSTDVDAVIFERFYTVLPYLERLTHFDGHASNEQLLRSFLEASKWASYPYWHQHQDVHSGALPCAACNAAQEMHIPACPDHRQGGKLSTILGSCFGKLSRMKHMNGQGGASKV